MCERWVGDWTNCNILTPSSFVFSSTSFSFCWAAQSGVLRVHIPLLGAGSLYSILSPTNWLQLNWTSCRTGLYHCLTSTCFLWASHLHPIQPVHSQGYTLISPTECTCSLINGWVESQYVTRVLQIFRVRLQVCLAGEGQNLEDIIFKTKLWQYQNKMIDIVHIVKLNLGENLYCLVLLTFQTREIILPDSGVDSLWLV